MIEIIESRRGPRRTAVQVARAVGAGRGIAEALRHLDAHGSEPDGAIVADALARFLVARCESRHAGWRVVRQVVVDSAADAPWEQCARRAIPAVSEDLLRISAEDGHTRLVRVQHAAARAPRRADRRARRPRRGPRRPRARRARGERRALGRRAEPRGERPLARAGRPRRRLALRD